ncbi:DnaA C-terminal domain-containing protein (plasmid) [Butyrivibrio proteoclasticus B316]|uniref:DnaA C-terminal domain-containing protein n=1 Tax=Butyrivibrio proteoclasticus (strain ATCC 51982 / DSM 14932 / B316) TaxID=515622 RepID=E0S520_BUTPB|nr:helix-turn-helix domain-containing protein [Butyrivibrio proteoclasticus]ADL36502.1 DnaA C-terminal domain-containing protein [Butyrivibrio proteoclasticus B316]
MKKQYMDSNRVSELQKRDTEIEPSVIMRAVCEYCHVDEGDIVSKKKDEKLDSARTLIMYLCRKYTDMSLEGIGKMLGIRDHTKVMSGIFSVKREMESGSAYAYSIAAIEEYMFNNH